MYEWVVRERIASAQIVNYAAVEGVKNIKVVPRAGLICLEQIRAVRESS